MTATLHHREPPAILPARHAQPSVGRTIARNLRRALTAAAHNTDRPWSIAVDAMVLAVLTGLMCWEIGEFGFTGVWEHLAAAVAVLVAGTLYAFRAFTTPDRSEHHR